MKKVLAIVLVLILICSIVACKATDNQTTDNATQNASTAPESTAPDADSPSTEDTPTEESATVEETASAEVSTTSGTVGYITDDVDHNARETYNIAYLYLDALTLEKAHFEAMQNMQERLNIEVTDLSASNDADRMITNIEVCAYNGYDGMVIEPNADIHPRIYEVAMETGLPFIYTVNAYRDENGANLVPVTVLDQYKNGQTQMQWMFDHYEDYWGEDVDTSKIVLLTLEFSTNPDLDTRSQGVKDKFAELLPGNEIIVGDVSQNGYSAQFAYDQCAALMSSHADIEYWWIAGATEDFGQGAARAVEAGGNEDITLIVTSGANVLPIEWDAGYNGCWVASYAVYNYNYVVPALCGLIALIDGRATFDTLWAETRKDGDIATAYIAGDQMVTVDTYKTVQEDIEKEFGIG